MESVYAQLTNRAVEVRQGQKAEAGPGDATPSRTIIVLAGPPGSGKSTVAAEVVRRINAQVGQPVAIVLPMDGFHYPRAYLDTMPNAAEAHERRGAHWTFDADGVVRLIKKLRASEQSGEVILGPSFDHATKDPMADVLRIEPHTEIVIVEGNWLLLDRAPWNQIASYADDTWLVDVDPALARHRVATRHLAAGIEKTWEAAVARAEGNDLRNGDEVRKCLVKPNVVVMSVEEGQGVVGRP